MKRYLVIIEQGRGNYAAYSPDVPGCVAAGDTVEETLTLMQRALEMHLEGMAEDGDELPKPQSVAAVYLDVREPLAQAA
jgi:predicted RNase H-like HicB family nuclease